MKNKQVLIVLTLFSSLVSFDIFGQEYYFNYRKEFLPYLDSKNEVQFKQEKTIVGSFRFLFETGVDKERTPLFTLYNDRVEEQWYGLLSNSMNKQINGKICKASLYLATTSREKVTVYFSLDKSFIALVYPDKIFEYYK